MAPCWGALVHVPIPHILHRTIAPSHHHTFAPLHQIALVDSPCAWSAHGQPFCCSHSMRTLPSCSALAPAQHMPSPHAGSAHAQPSCRSAQVQPSCRLSACAACSLWSTFSSLHATRLTACHQAHCMPPGSLHATRLTACHQAHCMPPAHTIHALAAHVPCAWSAPAACALDAYAHPKCGPRLLLVLRLPMLTVCRPPLPPETWLPEVLRAWPLPRCFVRGPYWGALCLACGLHWGLWPVAFTEVRCVWPLLRANQMIGPSLYANRCWQGAWSGIIVQHKLIVQNNCRRVCTQSSLHPLLRSKLSTPLHQPALAPPTPAAVACTLFSQMSHLPCPLAPPAAAAKAGRACT